MIEININKINKNYGFNKVLDNISFTVKTNEKIALIGSNGCGKSTILKMIAGIEEIDSGEIIVKKDSSIGYLSQIPNKEKDGVLANEVFLRGIKKIIDLETTINEFISNMNSSNKDIKQLDKLQEEFRILGGYKLNETIEKVKYGFKLSNELLNTEYNKLSGGEKTIVNLASLILKNPDILLLDEPTNHLDIDTLEWFENYLINYKGTILIVSHDRYFLDKTINKIICMEHGHEDIYHGNYSYYLEESEKRLLLEYKSYNNQQKEIKAIKEAIERYKEWGSKSDNPMFFRRAAALQTRLDKMDLIDKPKEKSELKLNLNVNERTSNWVLRIEKLNLNVEGKELLVNSNMDIYYKQRVCLMGKNGTGKTTLIKNIINNTHDKIKLGTNINIGYIPQEIRFDNDELTIYEHCRNFFIGNESELRSKLHQFYFGEQTIDKKIKTLSGGEKVRIKLLELVLKNANFLILDEPTNHIDIDTKEILEETLLNYQGTILFISHDRYFINKIATNIVRIENKKLISYNGNYDSIINKQPITNETKIQPTKEIKINGSNRLKEFIKDSNKIEEISNKNNITTYRIKKKSKTFYLKVSNHLSRESIKLEYLQDKLPVPEKIFYEKYNGMSYLLTKEVRGRSLDNKYYTNGNQLKGIDILIDAFNYIYNINYSDCIIDETIDTKIKLIEESINNINIDNELLKRFINKEGIIKYLKGNKPKQIIGFTHGNMKLSNIIEENGIFKGFISISNSGLCDIYYDLVVCEKSIEEIYGKEYIDIFYNKIGIEKDELRSDYYRILSKLIV